VEAISQQELTLGVSMFKSESDIHLYLSPGIRSFALLFLPYSRINWNQRLKIN
jgi:hypothetical protein